MIYRSPEPKARGPRLGAERELALWLVAMAFLTAVVLTIAGVPGQPKLAELAATPSPASPTSPVAFDNPTQGAGFAVPSAASTPTADFFGGLSPNPPTATSSFGFGMTFPTPSSLYPPAGAGLPTFSASSSSALPTISLPSGYPAPANPAPSATSPGLFSAEIGASPTPGRAASTMTAVALGTAGLLPTSTTTVTSTSPAYPGTGTPTATTSP